MPETRIPEALALLREKGWCQFRRSDGFRHCVIGAVETATRATCEPARIPDLAAIAKVVEQHFGFDHIADFNDHLATTFADVEFVLEKAALERGGAL